MALAISPIFQGLGVFFVTLERQYGWSRTVLSGAFSLARAEDTFIGPLSGYLTDRLGARRIVLIGFIVLGFGYILLSTVRTVPMFYLAFISLTIGSGLAGFVPVMSALNQWFNRRRASAMGISQSGLHWGGVLLAPALAWGVTIADWRLVALALAVAMFVAAGPISMGIRNRPEDYGERPDGDKPDDVTKKAQENLNAERRGATQDFTLRQALRTRAFWLVSFAHACPAAVFVTLTIHAIPMIVDKGFSLGQAAAVVATFSLAAGVCQFLGGFLGDHVPRRLAIMVLIAIQSAGIVIAVFAQSPLAMFVFAFVFGIGAGGRVPSLVALRGDYFGRTSFATILGFSSIAISLTTMGGPVLVGYVVDQSGSYTSSLWGMAVVSSLGALCIGFARPPAHKSA